jgi:hypothetical protein
LNFKNVLLRKYPRTDSKLIFHGSIHDYEHHSYSYYILRSYVNMFLTKFRRNKKASGGRVEITITKRRPLVSGVSFINPFKNRLRWRSDCTNLEMAKMHALYRQKFHTHCYDRNILGDNLDAALLPPIVVDYETECSTLSSLSTTAAVPHKGISSGRRSSDDLDYYGCSSCAIVEGFSLIEDLRVLFADD